MDGKYDTSKLQDTELIHALVACRVAGESGGDTAEALEVAEACTKELIARGMRLTDDPKAYAEGIVYPKKHKNTKAA